MRGQRKEIVSFSALLRQGADADSRRWSVTPLQVAVACWDVEGTAAMLQLKTGPNNTGNVNGEELYQDGLYSALNGLAGPEPVEHSARRQCRARKIQTTAAQGTEKRRKKEREIRTKLKTKIERKREEAEETTEGAESDDRGSRIESLLLAYGARDIDERENDTIGLDSMASKHIKELY